jgi:hypothetical protein
VPFLDALEEPDPGLYLYRWPDGDVSIVYADSPVEALVQLDEFGEAGTEGLVKFDQFLANFKLNDRGAVVLDRLSETVGPEFWTHSYPLLAELFAELGMDPCEERDQLTAVEARRIKKAVKAELDRVLPNRVDVAPAERPVGRHLRTKCISAGRWPTTSPKKVSEEPSKSDLAAGPTPKPGAHTTAPGPHAKNPRNTRSRRVVESGVRPTGPIRRLERADQPGAGNARQNGPDIAEVAPARGANAHSSPGSPRRSVA